MTIIDGASGLVVVLVGVLHMEMRHQKVGSKNRWRLKPKDVKCQSERYYVQDYKERFGDFFFRCMTYLFQPQKTSLIFDHFCCKTQNSGRTLSKLRLMFLDDPLIDLD